MIDFIYAFGVVFFLIVLVGGSVIIYLAYRKPNIADGPWTTNSVPHLVDPICKPIKLPDSFYEELAKQPVFTNPTGLFMNAPRLYEIAKEYREHMLMAATDGEDLSLADEIEQIISDVEVQEDTQC